MQSHNSSSLYHGKDIRQHDTGLSGPHILLIRAGAAHILHHLLAPLGIHASALSDDLAEDITDLPGHVRGVAADVEVCFLAQQVVDKGGLLLHQVLHVNFFRRVAREGVEDVQVGRELGFIGLRSVGQSELKLG